MIPIPDLLHLEPYASHDYQQLAELLDLAFAGGTKGIEIGEAMGTARPRPSSWQPEFFTEDLFLDELIDDCFRIEVGGRRYPINEHFFLRVLHRPCTDADEIRLRQGVVRELEDDAELRALVEQLYTRLFELSSMFRAPGDSARLDFNAYRLDILRAAKEVIDSLEADFGGASSALRRLHDIGREIREGREYEILESLLDHLDKHTILNVDVQLGVSGRITGLEIRGVRRDRENRFHQTRLQQWWQKLKIFAFYGKRADDDELAFRLVHRVYDEISPALTRLVQLLGHLEVYLANRHLKRRAESRGLAVCLPDVGETATQWSSLFNPLLLRQARTPVPCSIAVTTRGATTLITGPNSGGKTRFLQALGIAQLLGQCGLFTPATSGRIAVMDGIFVSLIEREAVDHEEGRLGRELERIRTMFEAMGPRSLVVLDELCSGTNPSEGIEVFHLVLKLLDQLRPLTFVTTHFLDFAQQLAADPPIDELRFLQVRFDERQQSTYQFLPGVASTSLASVMAERMGVTYDRLARVIEDKNGGSAKTG